MQSRVERPSFVGCQGTRKKSYPFFSFKKQRIHHLAEPQTVTSDGVPLFGPAHANVQLMDRGVTSIIKCAIISPYQLPVHVRTSASHTRSATEIAILTASVSTGLEGRRFSMVLAHYYMRRSRRGSAAAASTFHQLCLIPIPTRRRHRQHRHPPHGVISCD